MFMLFTPPRVLINPLALDVADAGQNVVGDLVRSVALPLLEANVPDGYGAVFVKFRFVVIRCLRNACITRPYSSAFFLKQNIAHFIYSAHNGLSAIKEYAALASFPTLRHCRGVKNRPHALRH